MHSGDSRGPGAETRKVFVTAGSSVLTSQLTRRRFIALGGAVVAGGILTACMGDDDNADETVNDREGTPTLVGATRTPESAIETPRPAASPGGSLSASPAGSPPAGDSGNGVLDRFMALSRALTGFDDLDDTELGQVYLNSISGDADLSDQLGNLYDKAGLSDGAAAVTLDQLERAGAFDDDTRPVADTIATYWYTGRYDAGGDQPVVATYINAIAWQATGYRTPGPSTCSGATGNWTAPVAA